MCNLFRDPSATFVMRERRQKAIESVAPHLSNPKATVREAAVTVLLNYSISFLAKDDEEGKIQVLSALGVLAGQQLDEQTKKRLDATVANVTYKYKEGKELAAALNLL